MSRSYLVRDPVAKLHLDVQASNITTSAWQEIEDSLAAPVSALEIFNGTGKILKLATGAAGSESELNYYLIPGTTSPLIPVSFAKGARLSLQSVGGSATTGDVVINCFG